MSYNQPPPQPGPYGGGQPNPYGGAPQQPPGGSNPYAQQPGYGYPQQQPAAQPGYGYPQQPPAQSGYGYPQQPDPGQAPPPQQPGGGSNRTKVIAISSAAVVVVAAVAVGAFFLTGKGESTDAMRLVTPNSLHDDDYELDKDTKALKDAGTSVQQDMPEGTTSVLASYKHADDPNSGLSFSGMYGDIGDPAKIQDEMFKSFESGGKAAVEKKRASFQPNGADGPKLSCEVVKMYDEYYAPVCAWAEKTDAAMVLDLDADNTNVDDVDVEEFAKVTAGIYEETRKPAE
ncbi:hypothetical protein LRS74_22955 [Streptomyces sp. LX-29]|uniref:hypothetical protein n=1 Tax=Streptomyces sp. LX-29 TaxID=2900152 RepID=UPI00240E1D67|nr:hypothetical protein [Streptomyces sp. LX-29]WFB09586.1 hypothetical protein LRS74_22955 [Streptomyces sp. LX-29]